MSVTEFEPGASPSFLSNGNGSSAPPRLRLAERFGEVRRFSEKLSAPLATEDYVIQSMPDASPTKWHLAHTSWFFETFILRHGLPGYQSPFPQYDYLFNSYYNAVGDRHCRDKRGLLSRPTVEDTYRYRKYIDQTLIELLNGASDDLLQELEPILILGLQHEQQHQELILTDIKHVFSLNPLRPAYQERPTGDSPGDAPPLGWVDFEDGLYWVGYKGDDFYFDNEGPRHREWLNAFALGNRLATNGEYLAFMEDGGYERPEFWLSAGWATAQSGGWKDPFYWRKRENRWWTMTLSGMQEVNPAEPICHLSYFEADAYARWAGGRLPTEAEWEVAAQTVPIIGNFAEGGRFQPAALDEDLSPGTLAQMYGDVWEWTQSSYAPYPGYHADPGALGEYNGKFMCGQYVLRGGSCATSRSHIRSTYRNFFPPDARWQFSGVRLAKDA